FNLSIRAFAQGIKPAAFRAVAFLSPPAEPHRPGDSYPSIVKRSSAPAMFGVPRSAYLGPNCVRTRSIALTAIGISLLGCAGGVRPWGVSSSRGGAEVEAYAFFETPANFRPPAPSNPFTDAQLHGWFESVDGRFRREIEGFCDSPDGKVFRIRFTPPA